MFLFLHSNILQLILFSTSSVFSFSKIIDSSFFFILVKADCSNSNSPSEQNFHPPAFYVLLNHIVNHGFMERQLFQINGDPDEVRAIIDTIDGEQVVGNVSAE